MPTGAKGGGANFPLKGSKLNQNTQMAVKTKNVEGVSEPPAAGSWDLAPGKVYPVHAFCIS